MCVDFTDLNNASPKDSFLLLRIDQLVNSTIGHKLLTFMDAFSGYNQIKMSEEDQEKTAFITSQGLYCYKVIPFRLKNPGTTYQRLVNKMFSRKIRRNIEVYVDVCSSKAGKKTLTWMTLKRPSRPFGNAKWGWTLANAPLGCHQKNSSSLWCLNKE